MINPSCFWGRIFGVISINSKIYNAGMINFEFDLFGEAEDDLDRYITALIARPILGSYVHFAYGYLSRNMLYLSKPQVNYAKTL